MATSMNRIYTIPELRDYLAGVNGHMFNVFPCARESDDPIRDSAEDPVVGITGLNAFMNWVMEHPARLEWGENAGYLIYITDNDGKFVGAIIF